MWLGVEGFGQCFCPAVLADAGVVVGVGDVGDVDRIRPPNIPSCIIPQRFRQ